MTCFVRSVLIRTNMVTSGYVARIPLVNLSPAAKKKIALQARNAYQQRVSNGASTLAVKNIDELIYQDIHLPQSAQREILNFTRHLIKLT